MKQSHPKKTEDRNCTKSYHISMRYILNSPLLYRLQSTFFAPRGSKPIQYHAFTCTTGGRQCPGWWEDIQCTVACSINASSCWHIFNTTDPLCGNWWSATVACTCVFSCSYWSIPHVTTHIHPSWTPEERQHFITFSSLQDSCGESLIVKEWKSFER